MVCRDGEVRSLSPSYDVSRADMLPEGTGCALVLLPAFQIFSLNPQSCRLLLPLPPRTRDGRHRPDLVLLRGALHRPRSSMGSFRATHPRVRFA